MEKITAECQTLRDRIRKRIRRSTESTDTNAESKDSDADSNADSKDSNAKPKDSDADSNADSNAEPKDSDAVSKDSNAKPKDSDADPKDSNTKPKDSDGDDSDDENSKTMGPVPVMSPAEVEHFHDLGLGRGVDSSDPKLWQNKSPMQIRTIDKELRNIIGTDESRKLNRYQEARLLLENTTEQDSDSFE